MLHTKAILYSQTMNLKLIFFNLEIENKELHRSNQFLCSVVKMSDFKRLKRKKSIHQEKCNIINYHFEKNKYCKNIILKNIEI